MTTNKELNKVRRAWESVHGTLGREHRRQFSERVETALLSSVDKYALVEVFRNSKRLTDAIAYARDGFDGDEAMRLLTVDWDDEGLPPGTFVREWERKWGPRLWFRDTLVAVEAMCSALPKGPVLSSVKAESDIAKIRARAEVVASGCSPSGGGFSAGAFDVAGGGVRPDLMMHRKIGPVQDLSDDT